MEFKKQRPKSTEELEESFGELLVNLHGWMRCRGKRGRETMSRKENGMSYRHKS